VSARLAGSAADAAPSQHRRHGDAERTAAMDSGRRLTTTTAKDDDDAADAEEEREDDDFDDGDEDDVLTTATSRTPWWVSLSWRSGTTGEVDWRQLTFDTQSRLDNLPHNIQRTLDELVRVNYSNC